MLDKINNWIDETLIKHSSQMISCECFSLKFEGFYPKEFLSNTSYVTIDRLPKPDFPELRQAGFGDFIDKDLDGVTYKNVYFIKSRSKNDLALHFHELVHVLQWENMGALPFIKRYMEEIHHFGYQSAPLEKMAYDLQKHFSMAKGQLNIPKYVQSKVG